MPVSVLSAKRQIACEGADEKRFYRYDETTGLWRTQSHAALEQLSCDTINAETDGSSLYLKHAPLAFARAVVGHLEGMTEHRVDEFKRLPLRKAAPNLNPML